MNVFAPEVTSISTLSPVHGHSAPSAEVLQLDRLVAAGEALSRVLLRLLHRVPADVVGTAGGRRSAENTQLGGQQDDFQFWCPATRPAITRATRNSLRGRPRIFQKLDVIVHLPGCPATLQEEIGQRKVSVLLTISWVASEPLAESSQFMRNPRSVRCISIMRLD